MSIALTFLAAFLKAYMDFLQFSEIDSWRNKWKNGDKRQGEKFPFSSTILVFLTDRWHFAQSLFLWTIFVLIVTYKVQYTWWIDMIGLRFVFGVTFEMWYRYFRRR
tara:strand:- start:118 stop:435 length:318 start_codon:yes stop_codon:yes gene_type:complete